MTRRNKKMKKKKRVRSGAGKNEMLQLTDRTIHWQPIRPVGNSSTDTRPVKLHVCANCVRQK
jgi:hypothetical protein